MAAQLKPSQISVIDPHKLNVADAKLPVVYESAKLALAQCSRIDECKDWANKAEALASYARQADDDTLRNMAVRIQARAIRRCGELLKEIESARGGNRGGGRPSNNGNQKEGALPLVSRTQAARDAGLSEHQQKTALRVANVPVQQFESAVESTTPPTVTKLAEIGTKPKPLVDLKGRSPDDFAACTRARGATERFDEFAAQTSPAAVVRGASENDKAILKERASRLIEWLLELQKELAL